MLFKNGRRCWYVAFAALLLLVLQTTVRGQSFFYYPKRETPNAPTSNYYSVVPVSIPNGDDNLAAWVFEPKTSKLEGTVVFSHGNAGNMEDHVAFVDFLPRHGFRVLMYDYRGYGESTPLEPTRESTVSDLNAAIDFAGEQWGKPWLMGHSLGASLTIAVAAKRSTDVKGVVAVAPFTSYGAVARAGLRKSILARALVLPSYVVVPRAHEPIDAVGQIAPTPLLLVHAEDDTIIPPRMSRELFEKAGEPKHLLIVPHTGHNNGWSEMGDEYVATVCIFLRGKLPRSGPEKPTPSPKSAIRSSSSVK
jgi:pimeloyl-ACP methyl ester carboxylesterase